MTLLEIAITGWWIPLSLVGAFSVGIIFHDRLTAKVNQSVADLKKDIADLKAKLLK